MDKKWVQRDNVARTVLCVRRALRRAYNKISLLYNLERGDLRAVLLYGDAGLPEEQGGHGQHRNDPHRHAQHL